MKPWLKIAGSIAAVVIPGSFIALGVYGAIKLAQNYKKKKLEQNNNNTSSLTKN